MAIHLSEQEQQEREAIIADIHRVFGEVTRGNAISWSESEVIDGYGSEEECAAARKQDLDKHWSELIDNPNWQPFPGVGGFIFTNAAGFRYYFPPTMIRFLRGDDSEGFPGQLLGVMSSYMDALTPPELHVTAKFVAFMARVDTTGYRELDDTTWQEALRDIWAKCLDPEYEAASVRLTRAERRKQRHKDR